MLDKLCFNKNLIPYILNAFCYHSSFFLLCFLLIGLMRIIVFDWKKSDQLDFNIVNLIIYHMCSCFWNQCYFLNEMLLAIALQNKYDLFNEHRIFLFFIATFVATGLIPPIGYDIMDVTLCFWHVSITGLFLKKKKKLCPYIYQSIYINSV